MKHRICSYRLQDGRWRSAFVPPPVGIGHTESDCLGEYFPTKEKADKYAYEYLMEEGVRPENIESS